MKLHEVRGPIRKKARRVGRGLSAGQGKTAGRGTKGQRARTGFNLPRRFEGGQSSLIQRLPKRRGFRSVHMKPPTVRIDRILAKVNESKITVKKLLEVHLLTPAEAKQPRIKLVGSAANLRPFTWTRQFQLTKQLAQALKKLSSDSNPSNV